MQFRFNLTLRVCNFLWFYKEVSRYDALEGYFTTIMFPAIINPWRNLTLLYDNKNQFYLSFLNTKPAKRFCFVLSQQKWHKNIFIQTILNAFLQNTFRKCYFQSKKKVSSGNTRNVHLKTFENCPFFLHKKRSGFFSGEKYSAKKSFFCVCVSSKNGKKKSRKISEYF